MWCNEAELLVPPDFPITALPDKRSLLSNHIKCRGTSANFFLDLETPSVNLPNFYDRFVFLTLHENEWVSDRSQLRI